MRDGSSASSDSDIMNWRVKWDEKEKILNLEKLANQDRDSPASKDSVSFRFRPHSHGTSRLALSLLEGDFRDKM